MSRRAQEAESGFTDLVFSGMSLPLFRGNLTFSGENAMNPSKVHDHVLDQVQIAIDSSLLACRRREEAFAAGRVPQAEPSPFASIRMDLKQRSLGEPHFARAERLAQSIEEQIRAGEESLRQLTERSEAMRRRLADWVGRAIG